MGEIDRNQAGALMPATTLRNLEGRELNLGALQGTPVLVNLWATWCAPCVKELPLIDALASDYDDRLHVITVSQDAKGAEVVGPFFAKGGYRYLESWMDPEANLGFALGGGSLPMTVLYDASGQEVWRVTGDFDWSSEEARAAIEQELLAD
ncbi:TlpA family protein disulfide reductase [Qipengyuania soli]|nr:TlpA disulfide reductase family protein [Qipengyuania soli]